MDRIGIYCLPAVPSFVGLQSYPGSRVTFRNIRMRPVGVEPAKGSRSLEPVEAVEAAPELRGEKLAEIRTRLAAWSDNGDEA